MTRRSSIAAAFLLSLGTASVAEPLATVGIGTASCTKLAADMKPSEGFNNITNALIYFWMQGYMSAANIIILESEGKHVDLSTLDETKMLPIIHEYCLRNPDHKPIALFDKLIDEAPKLAGAWKKGAVGWAAQDDE